MRLHVAGGRVSKALLVAALTVVGAMTTAPAPVAASGHGVQVARTNAAVNAEDAALQALIDKLPRGGFSKRIKTVEEIAALGDSRGAPVLEALLGGLLFERKEDGAVVIGAREGRTYKLTDPLSGVALGEAGGRDLKKVRVNNRVRGAIRGAMGGLTLLSKHPAKRREAAAAVFKAPDVGLLPVLERALEQETEADIKADLINALAATRLLSDDPAIRVAAVNDLASVATPEARAMLGALIVKRDDGGFADPDENVRAAAVTALEAIDSELAFWGFVENFYQGLSLGSVLLLAAIGLAITFGVMGVINMAHGEMVMLGAYTTFMVQETIRQSAPWLFDYSLFMAVPLAFLVSGAVGVAIERGVIRYLYGRPLETLLMTWGLSLILQQAVRTIFGPTNREVGSPSWMQGAVEVSGGFLLTYNRLGIIVFAVLVFAALLAVMRFSRFGLRMRAVTQNRPMASAMGIRTGWVDAMTFGLGSGVAGMAGVALSQIDNVSPNLGQSYIIDSFLVVVFGGVGNLWGTLVGALSLGVANKFLEPYAGAVAGKIILLVMVILFIQKRPRGLFALKGRAVES